MKYLNFLKLFIVFSVFFIIQSCGDGGTNGNLSMSDLTLTDMTGGVYEVAATAVYTPPAGKVANQAEIKFTYNVTGNTTKSVIVPSTSATATLGSTGAAGITLNINQIGEAQLVQVVASIGDLSVAKSVSVPSL